jgi:hypothetical protein
MAPMWWHKPLGEKVLDEDDEMREPCALVLEETFAARNDFSHRIGELGAEKMDKVCRALALASGCR